MLGERMDHLRQSLGATQLQRRLQLLEELMAQVRMQDRKALKQRAVPSTSCDSAVLERLDDFLEHRLRGIRHLKDIVRKDVEDAGLMSARLRA